MPVRPSTRNAFSCNPATGDIIATYAFQSERQVEKTLSDAEKAYGIWRQLPIEERIILYKNLANILRERKATLASIITVEMGKPLLESYAEVEKCALTIDWVVSNGPDILSNEPAFISENASAYVSYLPIGTVLGVMPWNFPLWQVVRAAVPLMLSGNGFLLKHAPNVMGSAYMLQSAFEDAGFPKGIFLNLNIENEVVSKLIEDNRIAAVTVTGSMRAGSAIAARAGTALKKSLLELGGTDAFIVLSDADIDRAVEAGIQARFQNAGQVCLAAKRFILEKSIADEFIQKFVAWTKNIKIGDPQDLATSMGPMARADLRDELHTQVEQTIAAGAVKLLGGVKVEGPGNFYQPTVLTGVRPGMKAFDEETFGPVAAMTIATDPQHAVELANTSQYGLSCSLWGRDTKRARDMARNLETGGVFVNGFSASNPAIPVGGVKKSGYGRELSHFGLKEFTNAQVVFLKS